MDARGKEGTPRAALRSLRMVGCNASVLSQGSVTSPATLEQLPMIMVSRKQRPDGGPPSEFVPGELVRHRRYGYRGVVVDFDSSCQAPNTWYQSNKSQPKRDQPWYHVLVDGSTATTYAAEDSLRLDHTRVEIQHPMLALYFGAFLNGGYERNDRPWGLP
ncbi:MAG: heat shock protein HspQ [Planctomycetota bacterium]|jgi:heat shock protein HspQ